MLNTIITSTITAIIASFLVVLVATPNAQLGGFTNYDELELNGSGATGTTTLRMVGTQPSCIQMRTSNGSSTRIYLSATTTALTIAEGTCK